MNALIESEPFPVPGMTKRPYGLPLMLEAWQGCVSFAAHEPEIIARFVEETGWKAPGSPIERMIDEATGRPAAVFAQFCDWVTVNVWGEEGSDMPEPCKEGA